MTIIIPMYFCLFLSEIERERRTHWERNQICRLWVTLAIFFSTYTFFVSDIGRPSEKNLYRHLFPPNMDIKMVTITIDLTININLLHELMQ